MNSSMPVSRLRAFLAASAAVLLLVGCGATGADAPPGSSTPADPSVAGPDIVIGQVMPLTGPLAEAGTRMNHGAEIARQFANATPCIPGRQFVWNTVDAPDDEAARTAAERLASDDVDIVFGTMGSSLALAASSVVARAGGIYWEIGGGSATALTERGLNGVYRVSSTATGLGMDAAKFATDVLAPKLGIGQPELKIAWAGVNNSYGTDVHSGVKKIADELGLKLVAELEYSTDSTDLSAVALQLKNADPDILILTNYAQDAALLGRAMREADVTPKATIGTGAGHTDQTWVEAMGSDGNGYFNIGPAAQVDPSGLLPAAAERHDAYDAAYLAGFGEAAGGLDRMSFDAAWALFQTVCAAGTTDPAAFNTAASAMDIPERTLLNGDGLKFGPTGQNERVQWSVSQWQDGKLVLISPADLAVGEAQMVPLPGWSKR